MSSIVLALLDEDVKGCYDNGCHPSRIAMSMAEVVEPLPIGLLIQWGNQADSCTGVVVQAGRSIELMHRHLLHYQRCLYFSGWAKAAFNSQSPLHR